MLEGSGDADVVVVGAGPVGMTAAALLDAQGVRTLVLERNSATSDEPKAISIDDESLRVYQWAGLVDRVLDIIVPGTGTRYYDAEGQPLFQARAEQQCRYGYPFKNPFAQPDLERELASHLRSRSVDLRMGVDVTAVIQDGDGMRVDTSDGPVRARYVLGCDGGRSTVREQLGITMTGRSHEESWLVADVLGDAHDERYGMHHADPVRPRVVIPGRNGRCRYEFRLFPGEAQAGLRPPIDLVRTLLAPYRELADDEIERLVVYRFHSLVADRWRVGNAFLLGDAAHMMAPFAGQGLNSGIRDAANLAWKLAEVLAGRLTDSALESYAAERKPHAAASVALSRRLGRVVMTTNHRFARRRDDYLRAALGTAVGRDYLECMRYRPVQRYSEGLVADSDVPVGICIGQPVVFDARTHRIRLLDEAFGPGWALLGVGVEPGVLAHESRMVDALRPRVLEVPVGDRMPGSVSGVDAIVDLDGRLDTDLVPYRGRCVLLRPDRFVAAAWQPGHTPQLSTALCLATPVPA